jgi:hypothetical protein
VISKAGAGSQAQWWRRWESSLSSATAASTENLRGSRSAPWLICLRVPSDPTSPEWAGVTTKIRTCRWFACLARLAAQRQGPDDPESQAPRVECAASSMLDGCSAHYYSRCPVLSRHGDISGLVLPSCPTGRLGPEHRRAVNNNLSGDNWMDVTPARCFEGAEVRKLGRPGSPASSTLTTRWPPRVRRFQRVGC